MIIKTNTTVLDEAAEFLISRCNYVSLHFDTPDFSAASATELSFGGYQRAAIKWTPVGGATYVQTSAATFTGLQPPVTIAAIGLNTNVSGNDLVSYIGFDDPETFGSTQYVLPDEFLKLRLL